MAADGSIHELSFKRQAEIVCGKFQIGDTKLGIKYSLAGVADRKLCQYVSEIAFAKLQKECSEIVSPDGIKHLDSYARFGLRIEHMIPTKVVYDWLKRKYDAGELTVDYVEKTIRERLFCALITEEEDERLSDAGLQRKMPGGWDFDNGDIAQRYIAVGITMHAW